MLPQQQWKKPCNLRVLLTHSSLNDDVSVTKETKHGQPCWFGLVDFGQIGHGK